MPSYVVTGASRGLGYAFITHLASIPGNTVIGIARHKAGTEKRLEKDGVHNVHILSADITDVKALQVAADETARITGGGLDVLINNAALISEVSQWTTVVDHTPDVLEQDLFSTFHVNVIGVAHTIHAFLPLIRKGELKKVITLSTGLADIDVMSKFSIAICGPYSISKAATNALVAKYAAALGKTEGILFMSISPGLVDTRDGKPMTEADMKGSQEVGALFVQYAPHFTGPISSQESVTLVMNVVDKATVETMSGAFVSHYGNQQWL